jgi:hypothetical protein
MPFALEDIDESTDIDPLFPSLEEDMIVYLAHEGVSDKLLDRLLKDMERETQKSNRQTFQSNQFTIDMNQLAENVRLSIHSSMHSPKSQNALSPRACSFASTRLSPPIYRIAIHESIDAQNDLRSLIAKSQPATSASAPPDDVVKWLFEDEENLWRPLLAGPETSNDRFPGIDMIVAIGSDGRERRNSESPEEVKRSGELADILSESIEDLGRRGSMQARAVRMGLRHLVKAGLPYIASHPAATIQDFAKGKYLLTSLDHFVSQNPHSRLLIIDFDLSTGSDAILTLKHLLPTDILKIATVGDAIVPFPKENEGTNRIYVRTSVGKTTTSFSVLPSPITKTARPIRKQTAVMRLMAAADWVLGPRSDETMLVEPVESVKESIKARWRMLGRWDIRRVITPPVPNENVQVGLQKPERKYSQERVEPGRVERIGSVPTLKAPVPPPKDDRPIEVNVFPPEKRRGSGSNSSKTESRHHKKVDFTDSLSDVVIVERSPSPPDIDRTEISYYDAEEDDEDYECLGNHRRPPGRRPSGKHSRKALRLLGIE